MKRSGLRFEHVFLEVVQNLQNNKKKLADFALQNMLETTLADGLKTSGQRAYC